LAEANGERATGLPFFIEADFVSDSLSFWIDQGIGVKTKTAILACVSDTLSNMSIGKVPHKHSRYRLEGEVKFKGTQTAKILPGALPTSEKEMVKLEKALAEAKQVDVVRERVRVRKSPVDGEIIGFISKPAKVELIEKSDEWCLVKTKRGNVGWMVCWGLSADVSSENTADRKSVDETGKTDTAGAPEPKTAP
jgi:hypothetical protein